MRSYGSNSDFPPTIPPTGRPWSSVCPQSEIRTPLSADTGSTLPPSDSSCLSGDSRPQISTRSSSCRLPKQSPAQMIASATIDA